MKLQSEFKLLSHEQFIRCESEKLVFISYYPFFFIAFQVKSHPSIVTSYCVFIIRNCEIKSIAPYGVFVEIAPGREVDSKIQKHV